LPIWDVGALSGPDVIAALVRADRLDPLAPARAQERPDLSRVRMVRLHPHHVSLARGVVDPPIASADLGPDLAPRPGDERLGVLPESAPLAIPHHPEGLPDGPYPDPRR